MIPDREELRRKREVLMEEARRNGTLKCLSCGKVPPGNFMCHFFMNPQTSGVSYFFTCDSATCLNRVKALASRPEQHNVGMGLQSGEKIFDQREKPPLTITKLFLATDRPSMDRELKELRLKNPKATRAIVCQCLKCGETFFGLAKPQEVSESTSVQCPGCGFVDRLRFQYGRKVK